MSYTVTAIRQELANAIGTIDGLRSSPIVPPSFNSPVAVVGSPSIAYDITTQRGCDELTFIVTLYVSVTDWRSSQLLMDSFLNSDGASSVKAAVETIGYHVRLAFASEAKQEFIGDVLYLSVELTVQYLA